MGGGSKANTVLGKEMLTDTVISKALQTTQPANRQAQELRQEMNGETEVHEQGLMTRDNSHSKTDTGGQPTGMSCSIHKSKITGPRAQSHPRDATP